MKKNKLMKLLYSLFFIGLLINTSCSDFLDVSASNELPQGEAISNLIEARSVLNGAYLGMEEYQYYGAAMITYGDVRGEDAGTIYNGYRTEQQFTFGHLTSATSSNAGDFWVYIYKHLNRVNNLLEKINSGFVATSSDDEKAQLADIKGQALALRALMHFDLVRIYGEPYLKGDPSKVPGVIIADHVIAKGEINQRATIEQTYKFILDDLALALGDNSTPVLLSNKLNKGHMNYWAARALQSKVYLYMGKWNESYTAAVEVVNSPVYSLIPTSDYVKSWSEEFTTESLFDIHSSQTSNADRESIGNLYNLDGYNSISLTEQFWNLISEDPEDVRLGLVDVLDPGDVWCIFLAKYPGREGNVFVNNTHILRLSEIYLIAAEAGLRAGKADASDYLNAIRQRANPAAATVTATLDLVDKERRKELVGEGHRFFDIIRKVGYDVPTAVVERKGTPLYPINLDAANAKTTMMPAIGWNLRFSYLLILPIPFSEVQVNRDIIQNTGYANN